MVVEDAGAFFFGIARNVEITMRAMMGIVKIAMLGLRFTMQIRKVPIGFWAENIKMKLLHDDVGWASSYDLNRWANIMVFKSNIYLTDTAMEPEHLIGGKLSHCIHSLCVFKMKH